VRSRLVFASLAIAVVAGLIGWGLTPSAAGSRTAGTAVHKKSPYELATSVPASVRKLRPVFYATFGGTTLNTNVWNTCYPRAANDNEPACSNLSNKTTESEWYQASQVQVYGGALHLVSKKTPTAGLTWNNQPKEYSCRSGMVTSHPGFNFKYGYIQVIAHIPNNSGLWPALWLAASDLSWPPEVDLLEHWGPPKNTTGVFFHPSPKGTKPTVVRFRPGNLFKGWHTFGVRWTATQLSWYIDGKLIITVRQHIPHQKMYLVANVAHYVQKRGGSSSCNGTMLIRSVSVWQ
jgi:beta-glucanase (GH16 family)